MNKQIKWRIAQLNNGEVPNGYKKTDFGIFPCDWVTDKTLKDIGVFGKGKGIPGEKIQSEGVPCVGYGDIYMKFNNFHFDKVKSFVDEETANESQPIEKGTLLFTGTGETAEEIGKCVCYTGDEVIYAGGDIITFVSKQVNPLFLAYQQYQSYSLKKKASFGQGHSVVHIQKENLEKLNVAYPPSKEEQSRIVGILMKWDEALALYDKQIELLNLYKSICLRKMFPSKGKDVPEWRFHSFTGSWERRKLGDFIKDAGERTSNFVDFPLYSLTIENGVTPKTQRYERGFLVTKEDDLFKIVKPGYFVTNPMNLRFGSVGYNRESFSVSVSGYYDVFEIDDNQCSNFWNAYFRQPLVCQKFDDAATGSLIEKRRVHYSELKKIEFLVPSSRRERITIGIFIEKIDTLITLHQQTREKIQDQSKVLQQYLLNGIVRV